MEELCDPEDEDETGAPAGESGVDEGDSAASEKKTFLTTLWPLSLKYTFPTESTAMLCGWHRIASVAFLPSPL